MKLNKTFLLAPVAALVFFAGSAQAESEQAILERLKPVGVVCVKGQDCDNLDAARSVVVEQAAVVDTEALAETEAEDTAAEADAQQQEPAGAAEETAAPETESASAPVAAAGRPAEQIVTQYCGTCHTTGLLESPKMGDSAAWQQRFDAAGGMQGLVNVSKAGKGAMPPMGICMDCSDAEMESAIRFMSGL